MVAGKYGHRSVFEGITVGILLMAFITGCSHFEPKKLILSIILRGGKHTHTHTHIVHELTHHSVPRSFQVSVLGNYTQTTLKASH